jgi:uncharacterized protein (DUF1800 family)
MTLATTIAYNRFGLGATPQDVPVEARVWLLDQIVAYKAHLPNQDTVGNTPAVLQQFVDFRQARNAARKAGQLEAFKQDKTHTDFIHQAVTGQGSARIVSALSTPTPFAERLVHFWSNHFAISAEKQEVRPITGLFEFEAIRPHIMGTFADLWMAVLRHPAMLLYLDQAQSIGPNSEIAQMAKRRKLGLNENLAREAMELHSLGVRSGYTQADVTELARALTGWTVGELGKGLPPRFRTVDEVMGRFTFMPSLHEPGPRTVLGKRYGPGGEEQARQILLDLGRRPETATHIATKLATHFVGDTPPPALVRRVAAAFYQTGGDLPTTYRALIEAPEAWAPAAAKFKSPWDWAISAMRAIGLRQADQRAVGMMNQLGQPIWQPGSPAGWADTMEAWAAPDALLRRVEVAQNLVNVASPTLDARSLAPRLLGAIGAATQRMIAAADSPRQALVLMLASPEFQRR